jgi:hypothetical protein
MALFAECNTRCEARHVLSHEMPAERSKWVKCIFIQFVSWFAFLDDTMILRWSRNEILTFPAGSSRMDLFKRCRLIHKGRESKERATWILIDTNGSDGQQREWGRFGSISIRLLCISSCGVGCVSTPLSSSTVTHCICLAVVGIFGVLKAFPSCLVKRYPSCLF